MHIYWDIFSGAILAVAILDVQFGTHFLRDQKSIKTEWYCINCKYLTLKTPRKPASENVVCLCRLLNILANFSTYFCIHANSVDPDQTAPRGAV